MIFKCVDCGKRYFLFTNRDKCELKHILSAQTEWASTSVDIVNLKHVIDNDVNFMYHTLGLEHHIVELNTLVQDDNITPAHRRECNTARSTTTDSYESSSSSDSGCSNGD